MRRALYTIALLFCAFAAWGQGTPYPHKNVTLVTHSSPGGGSGARAVARVAQAPADGSVLYATTPTYIQTTLLSKPVYGYDSLMPVVNVFFDPEVIYTRTESPHRTLADAMKQARSQPGKGRWGASNPASLERIAMERLNRLTQARAVIISHEGGGDQMIGVLNGTYDIGIGEIQEVRAQLETKKVRLLAVLTERRLPGFPGLETAREQGIDLVVTKFRGLAGPKNLPPNVLRAWREGIRTVLADPAYRAEYERESLVAAPMGYEQAGPFIAAFAVQLAASLRELGLVR